MGRIGVFGPVKEESEVTGIIRTNLCNAERLHSDNINYEGVTKSFRTESITK
jgi:hypothetical protein